MSERPAALTKVLDYAALGEAWADAEAALPDGWTLHLWDYGTPGPFNPPEGEPFGQPRYHAAAKLGILSSPEHRRGSGDTPAAALRALAARLRESAT